MRITTRGRVTIPVAVREELGLRPGDEIDFVVEGDAARLIRRPSPGRGDRIVARLRGRGDVRISPRSTPTSPHPG